MRKFFTVVAFSLFTIGFFTWFSNFGIPQINPAPPPVEEDVDLTAMTMDRFVVLGEKIYNGKGTCTLCHNAVGGRAPLLDQVVGLVPERLADPRYKGGAKDVASYLQESLTEPSAYVVAGFGKKGSNDNESPMPNIAAGSIGLSEAELKAVVAYLQQWNGAEVTVKIPTGTEAAPEDDDEDESEGRELLATAEEVIAEFSCGACHKVAGEEGEVGPDLSAIGTKRDKGHLRQSILDPNAEISEGFEPDAMPADYGEQLYAKELELVVEYLAALK